MPAATITAPTGEPVIHTTRMFDAPRDLVWKVSTEPFHFAQWWGPRGYTNPVCEMDVRPGGKWRVEQRSPDGRTFKFHGEFLEVEAPSRMVQTFAFADYPAATVSITYEAVDGRTRLTSVMRFDTLAERDGMVASGMERGAEESYERLDALLSAYGAAAEITGQFGPGETPAVRSGYASANGVEMYYEVHGSGRPLILIHGGFGLGQMFAPILPRLEGRQVIAIDLQGHGHTADIDRPFGWDTLAADVAALIGALGLERPDVLGYSFGGGVALSLALNHPKLLGRLVLVSTPMRQAGWFPEVIAGMARIDAAAGGAMKGSPMYAAYVAAAPNPENWTVLAAKTGNLLRTPYDWSAAVAAMKVPTLLAFGDADSIGPGHAAEFFGLLGGGKIDAGWDGAGMVASRLTILPATTHYNIFLSPGLWTAVNDFLDVPVGTKGTA